MAPTTETVARAAHDPTQRTRKEKPSSSSGCPGPHAAHDPVGIFHAKPVK